MCGGGDQPLLTLVGKEGCDFCGPECMVGALLGPWRSQSQGSIPSVPARLVLRTESPSVQTQGLLALTQVTLRASSSPGQRWPPSSSLLPSTSFPQCKSEAASLSCCLSLGHLLLPQSHFLAGLPLLLQSLAWEMLVPGGLKTELMRMVFSSRILLGQPSAFWLEHGPPLWACCPLPALASA